MLDSSRSGLRMAVEVSRAHSPGFELGLSWQVWPSDIQPAAAGSPQINPHVRDAARTPSSEKDDPHNRPNLAMIRPLRHKAGGLGTAHHCDDDAPGPGTK